MIKGGVIIKEYLFSIDNFNKPKELNDNDAVYMLLVRLMLLTPGTIQTHPDMGVGIVTKWRYCDIDQLGDLQLEITRQISTYLPTVKLVDVNVKAKPASKELIIEIKANGVLYSLETDNENNTLRLANLFSN